MEGTITSLFGNRINPITGNEELHNGLDIAAPVGTDVVAVMDGVVMESRYSPTYGNLVLYESGTGYQVMYAHLSESLVSPGEQVKKGQVIAKCGNTGNSTGPHLHYIIYYEDVLQDPIHYVDLPFTSEAKQKYLLREGAD